MSGGRRGAGGSHWFADLTVMYVVDWWGKWQFCGQRAEQGCSEAETRREEGDERRNMRATGWKVEERDGKMEKKESEEDC